MNSPLNWFEKALHDPSYSNDLVELLLKAIKNDRLETALLDAWIAEQLQSFIKVLKE